MPTPLQYFVFYITATQALLSNATLYTETDHLGFLVSTIGVVICMIYFPFLGKNP